MDTSRPLSTGTYSAKTAMRRFANSAVAHALIDGCGNGGICGERGISEVDFRQTIRAEANKIESCNAFLDWISFGGSVIKSGDPVEQNRQVKCMNLVANAIMLHNVADLKNIPENLAADGYPVTQRHVACPSLQVGKVASGRTDQLRRSQVKSFFQ